MLEGDHIYSCILHRKCSAISGVQCNGGVVEKIFTFSTENLFFSCTLLGGTLCLYQVCTWPGALIPSRRRWHWICREGHFSKSEKLFLAQCLSHPRVSSFSCLGLYCPTAVPWALVTLCTSCSWGGGEVIVIIDPGPCGSAVVLYRSTLIYRRRKTWLKSSETPQRGFGSGAMGRTYDDL